MAFWNFWKSKKTGNDSTKGIRIIKTVRGIDNIERAKKKNKHLLYRKVEPFSVCKGKYCILRDKLTGDSFKVYDFRDSRTWSDKYSIVTDWTYTYRNYDFPDEAAYIIPSDIEEGEIVFVKDLIENYIGYSHNQGAKRRLKGYEARWINNDLEILFNPEINSIRAVG
jgi:hypothetical protein